MAIFFLIRHGLNDMVGEKLAGRLPDIHLNEAGEKQARRLAAELAGFPIKAIFSSPLERTQETAAPIARIHDLPVEIMHEFLEIDFGTWQGKRIKQLRRQKLWEKVQDHPSEVTFPKGESFTDAQLRISGGLTALSEKFDEKELVVCVAHSDLIRLAVAYFLGMPLDKFQRVRIDPASVTVLFLQNGKSHFGPINYNFSFPKFQ